MIEDLFVPAVTPFGVDGSVDIATLIGYAEWLVGQGATGLVLYGTTGEGVSLSVEEKLATAKALTAALPQVPIVAAVTETSLVEGGRCVRGYDDLGLAGALLLPPGYFREDDADGRTAFLAALRAGITIPVLAYHIPNLAPAVPIDAIAELDLWGVKDSGGDLAYTEAVLASGRSVMVGAEAVVARAVERGASGTIAGMGNLLPGPLAEVCSTARSGDAARANQLVDEVLAVQALLVAAAPGMEWVAAMKQLGSALSGLDLGGVRLPLVRRRDYLTDGLRDALNLPG